MIAEKLANVEQQIQNLTQAKDILKQKLIELSENTSTRGGEFIFECIERKRSVQYKLIPELKTIDLEQYRSSMQRLWKLKRVPSDVLNILT